MKKSYSDGGEELVSLRRQQQVELLLVGQPQQDVLEGGAASLVGLVEGHVSLQRAGVA